MSNVLPLFERADMPVPERDGFADFWTLFPRKEARPRAIKAWDKIDSSEHVEVLIGLCNWRREWKRRGTDQEHIPLPASWLNDRRWEDELQDAGRPQVAHASHVVTKGPESGPKSEMPQHVKNLLETLRAKNRGGN